MFYGALVAIGCLCFVLELLLLKVIYVEALVALNSFIFIRAIFAFVYFYFMLNPCGSCLFQLEPLLLFAVFY